MKYEAIVIGVSAGGANALRAILPSLPGGYGIPVVVVQHLHPHSDGFWIEDLRGRCAIEVLEVDEKETVEPGVIYIAPPNYHVLVENDRTFALSTAERVNFARPSIDVLFESMADVYGPKLVGVILTGANHDGAEGLRKIKRQGGLAVVQDPSTAEVDSMPRAAIAATRADHILPLGEIGPFLAALDPKIRAKEECRGRS